MTATITTTEKTLASPAPDVIPHAWRDFWLVLFAALLFQVLAFYPSINPYDEGIVLAGAESVLAGKLPYKDFWTMYGPGQFYFCAWLFSLFGHSDLVVRAVGLASKALIVALAFATIRRTSSRAWAFGGAAVIAGILVAVHQDAFPVFPAIALAIGTLLALDRGRRGEPRYLLAAGILTALAACFRHDLGAYGAVAAALALAIDGRLSGGAGQWGHIARRIGCYGLGILLVALPVMAYFLAAVPLSDLYENLIYIPSAIYPRMRSLPWPDPAIARWVFQQPRAVAALAVYVPFLVFPTVLLLNAWHARGHRVREGVSEAGSFLVWAVALTGLLFTLKGLVRVSHLHMVQAVVLAVILLPTLYADALGRDRLGRLLGAAVLPAAIGLVLLLSRSGFTDARAGVAGLLGAERNLWTRCTEPLLPRGRCVDPDPDYVAAARFVAAHSSPDETIYVGAERHDKLFINAVAFYFLAGRQPATKWYELHPGVQTQLRVQEAMIEEMSAHPPRLIVLDPSWDDVQEPNLSSFPSGAVALDEFIASRYADVANFGPLRVLAPK